MPDPVPVPMKVVPFINSLEVNIVIYDSYSEGHPANYFGTLTQIAKVPANTTAAVQPIHTTSTFIVSNATTQVPLARRFSSLMTGTGPFTIGQADATAMTQTMAFIALVAQHPDDPVVKPFLAIIKDTSKLPVKPVNDFFAQHPPYESCTFETYMMGITYAAAQPLSKGKPLDQATYSLRSFVTSLGGSWPSDFPDILVTNFTCSADSDVFDIHATIDLKRLPARSDEALKFFGSLFNVQMLYVAIDFNYGFGMGIFGTRLAIGLDVVHAPCGGSSSLTIKKPWITIDVNPLFKFVVFTVQGAIPFTIFGKTFEADVSMVIDNIEANFGVVIKGDDNNSLPAPPVMKGVHFDQFDVGIGVFFEPPGLAIGLSGKLHIGEPGALSVNLDDDTFAVVCQLVEDVPNPLYVSFYVPQMHLTDVITVFTNSQTTLDVPVSFTNLSFKWSEDPMLPVALPDGSLSSMGYGFSAAVNILAFSFYGDIQIDLTNGLTADIEMGPLALGDVFLMGGTGTGVSIKVDANGSPIKNNQLPTTTAQQQAIKNATTKQLVSAGGPVLKFQTLASPFLVLNGHVSLFEVAQASLNALITTSGITFQMDFGAVLSSAMNCIVSDLHNLAATFIYGINETIQLPTIAGVSLGSFPLKAQVSAHLSLSTSTSDLILRVGGGFYFEGMQRNFGDFTADAHIKEISDVLSAVANYIKSQASQIFNDLLNTGGAWASKVKQGLITATNTVADVLHNAFNQGADEIAATMRDAGFDVDEITKQLKSIFDPSQVAGALKDTFNMSVTQVAQTMAQVGYAGEDVASALKNTFGDDAQQIASALQSAYGWSADTTGKVLGDIGFTANQIGNAFKDLGGDFASVGKSILHSIDKL